MGMARSKAAKRRAKKARGRPRLDRTAEHREPNGRRSRAASAIQDWQKQQEAQTAAMARIVIAPVIEARARVYCMPATECERSEAGYALGRMMISGWITEAQHDAGKRMAEDYERYYRLTGVQSPTPRAMDMFRVAGESGDPDPDAARKAANKFMELEGVLGRADLAGRPVTTITKRVCLEDRDEGMAHTYSLSLLRRGLDALVVHYRG